MTDTRKDQHPATGRAEIGSGDPGHPSSGQHQDHEHVHAGHQGPGHSPGPDAADSAHQVKDPVCGMMVDPHTTPHKAKHAGRPYHFCSAGCRAKFLAKPDRYRDPAAAAPAEPVPEGTIYTCPMHPEIRQVGPGSCPICGMALEPVLVSLEAEPNPELIDMRRRFRIGLVLTIPVFILEIGGHLFGIGHLVSQRMSNWIQLVLATPVVLWAGWPFFRRGWQSLVMRNLNLFTLIAMGTGAAWIYSIVATLAPGIFPAAFRQHDGSVAVYFEAAAVITILVLLGQVLELRARESTSGAIRADAADVGIAMGTGTDVAMESAGVTLLKGDLTGIVRARRLSQAVMRNIRQNLFFAFIYNALGIPVAAGVLYPVFGILLSPIFAAAAMALSSVSVIANASRLRGVKAVIRPRPEPLVAPLGRAASCRNPSRPLSGVVFPHDVVW